MKKLFIVGIAALLLVVFTVPAMAKVKMGGIIFTDFYYLGRDKENAKYYNQGSGTDSFSNTAIQVPNITRLYARWTNEDNVGMYIELGLGTDGGGTVSQGRLYGGEDAGSARVRHAYGWWDVTPDFQIMAGKSTTPFSPLDPSQLLGTRTGSLNVIGVGYGNVYSGRNAQVRATFKFNKNARIAVALVDPNTKGAAGGSYVPYAGTEPANYQTNTKLPRIDIGAPIYVGPVSIYPSLLYQYRTVDDISVKPSTTDDTIITWIGSLGVKGGFGGFGFAAEGNYGQNWGNTSLNSGFSGGDMVDGIPIAAAQMRNTSATTATIDDATTYSFWLDLSYKFGPVVPHVMGGMMKSEGDVLKNEGKAWFWGISVPIDVAKGFRIRPEVMWYDDGDSNKLDTNDGTRNVTSYDAGSYGVYGVQFQITF